MSKEKEIKLNTRQWKFYNYLKEQAFEDGDRWVSKWEISVAITDYEYNNSPYAHDECSTMNGDRLAINNSQEVDKLILVDNNCFKIAKLDEAIEMRNDYYNQAMRLLGKMSIIANKIDRDGQGKLISNQNKPIDETSKAREFYETFIKEN